MQRSADSRRPSAVALLPIALIAVVLVVLALVVKGSERGTIVVEHIVYSARSIQNGKLRASLRFSDTEITATAADGSVRRTLFISTFNRPEVQQVIAGQSTEIYDARENTIFATTAAGIQRATGSRTYLRSRLIPTPGRRSVFALGLRAHQYLIVGRASIDGRPALKLVQAGSRGIVRVSPGIVRSTSVFVTPRTDDPIEELTRTTLPGGSNELTERWTPFRVLPATSANARLLSLTALHPHAKIVHGARSYLRAEFTNSSG